jgi:DNA-binding LytR/AlgR family response regulator
MIAANVAFSQGPDQYAIRAFKAREVDYLLKRLDDERFDATLEKVCALCAPVVWPNGTTASSDSLQRLRTAAGSRLTTCSLPTKSGI